MKGRNTVTSVKNMDNILGVNYKNIPMTADEAYARIRNRNFVLTEPHTDEHSYWCLENDEDIARIEQDTNILEVSENFIDIVSGVNNERCEEEMKNILAFYIIVNGLYSCDLNTVLRYIKNTYSTTDDIYMY